MTFEPHPEPLTPWDRQKEEPDDAYRAFLVYLHMPLPRKVFTSSYTAPKHTLQKWSSQWLWASRVKEWDDHLGAVAAAEAESVVKASAREVTEQHIRSLAVLRELVQREAEKWTQYSRDASGPSVMKIADLTRLAETVIKYDRLVQGESTENVKEVGNFSNLSDEELEQFIELQKKAGIE